jgi:hypothetical protein
VASNIAVLPLLLRRSIRRPPFSGRPRRQCGIPALPLALLPTAAHLRPTAPPIPPATSARAYRAATDTPLGQRNHQKWCLSPGSVDLCNLSLFRRCTRTTLLTKRQIRRSESRSEEITAVQASTRLHAPPEGSARLPTRFTRSHAPPMVIHALPRALEPSARLPTRFTRSHAPPMVIHALPRALEPFCPFADALHALPRATHEIHAPPRALDGDPRAPTRSGTFWRVRSTRHIILPRPRAYWRVRYTRFLQPHALRVTHTRQAFFFQATRLLAREMHAPCSLHTLARALHAPGAPHPYLLPRVFQRAPRQP